MILVVIIPLLGQIFIANAFSHKNPNDPTNSPKDKVVIEHKDGSNKVNKAVKMTPTNARQSGGNYAFEELDVWDDELMNRVEDSFLDWYFGYFSQKQMDYKSLFLQLTSSAVHLLNPDKPTPAEKVAEVLTADFQKKFAKRVLMPQTYRLRLERLTQETVN